MLGLPAISIPCGFTRAGLPVGLQIVGKRRGEVAVLRAAAAFLRSPPHSFRRADVNQWRLCVSGLVLVDR